MEKNYEKSIHDIRLQHAKEKEAMAAILKENRAVEVEIEPVTAKEVTFVATASVIGKGDPSSSKGKEAMEDRGKQISQLMFLLLGWGNFGILLLCNLVISENQITSTRLFCFSSVLVSLHLHVRVRYADRLFPHSVQVIGRRYRSVNLVPHRVLLAMITLFLHCCPSFKCCRMTCCGMPQIMSLLKRRCRKTMSCGKNFDLLWNAPTGV